MLQKIDELDGIQDKSQLNILYTQWLDSLGAVEKCKSCKLTNTKVYFRKNFNLDWINDNNIFIESITNRLQFIEENRYVGTLIILGKGAEKYFSAMMIQRVPNSFLKRLHSWSFSDIGILWNISFLINMKQIRTGMMY
ncbi:hypothetical protein [Chryseobacterium proteolyticum]|uniref:hypothetical protein n=1 Tax=Chryseobacterium proteolyticum TaxID=118127 RepID=UPI003982F42D